MGFSVVYSENLAASTKTGNVISGDVNEFVSNGGVVTIYAVAQAIGIKMSVFADSDLIIDDKEIPFIGTTLVKKDHFLDSFEVEAGTRLSIFLRETKAVATNDVYVGVEVE